MFLFPFEQTDGVFMSDEQVLVSQAVKQIDNFDSALISILDLKSFIL